MLIAGTLENIDVERFRSGQKRSIASEVVHPKWKEGESESIYYDVGLIFLKEVRFQNKNSILKKL